MSLRALLAAAEAFLALAASAALGQPRANHPALSVLHAPGFVPVAVTGKGFGSASDLPAPQLEVESGAVLLVIPADRACAVTTCSESDEHDCVVYWEDDVLAAKLPPEFLQARLRVVTGAGASEWVGVHAYRYDFFGSNEGSAQSVGTNPAPQSLAVDPADPLHRVFFNEETHNQVKFVDPLAGAAPLPLAHPTPPPFWTQYGGGAGARSKISQRNQDTVIDPHGRVWFNEGGWPFYSGLEGNYARVLMYRFAAENPAQLAERRVYNLPGSHGSTIGLAYQVTAGGAERVWYAMQARSYGTGTVLPARVGWFDPEDAMLYHDGTRPFSSVACVNGFCADNPTRACAPASQDCAHTDRVCWHGESRPGCAFHEYPIPQMYTPGRMEIGRDGAVWLADFFGGSSLLRLDPETGASTRHPLGDDPSRGAPSYLGSAAWDVEIASDGDVLVSEFNDWTLNRFELDRVGDPLCEVLDGLENACVASLQVPGPDVEYEGPSQPGNPGSPTVKLYYHVHTLSHDPQERTWFTTTGDSSDPASRASVGWVAHDWSHAVVFPPLSLFPFCTETGANCAASSPFPGTFRAFRGGGIDYDTATEQVWFSDYCRKRIGRLRPRYPNLAEGRAAEQSSTLCDPLCRPADRATDGVVDGDLADGSVAHTDGGGAGADAAWWQVDLNRSYRVEEVELWSLADCCAGQPQELSVFLSKQPFETSDPALLEADPAVRSIRATAVERSLVIPVGSGARFVRVQQRSEQALALAEVIVLGRAGSQHCGIGTELAAVPLLLAALRRRVRRPAQPSRGGGKA